MFFEHASDRVVAGALDDAELDDFLFEKPQGPARISIGRCRAGQGDEPRFRLAVENRRDRRRHALLAAEHGVEPFFHQLLANPIDHRDARIQSLDDLAVAPAFAGLRCIGLQQYPRLQKALRRSRAFADHLAQPLAFLFT